MSGNTPLRILYVDDDSAARFVVEDQLTMKGYSITTAEDGVVAMEILTKHKFDLVLLDIQMPRKDGMGVLQDMRTRKIRPRIIMLTGVEDMDTALDAVKLGANDYITKPYSVDNLISCINRVLAR